MATPVATQSGDVGAMANEPVISVLMPVYNAERFLRAAVGSVLGQRFGDFELIAIDDGSTDRSLEILRSTAATDQRVRIISRANTGISGALNDGLAAARGEFVARIDADDLALPGRFEKQLSYMRAHPECVLLGSAVMLVDPYGTPLRPTEPKFTHEEIDAQLLSGDGWAVIHPSAMMRTAALRQVGGYRCEYVPIEDIDLFLRLAEVGLLANLPEVLLEYRQHQSSANRTWFDRQEALKRPCLAEARKRRGLAAPEEAAASQRHLVSAAEELRGWGWAAVKARRAPAARRHAVAFLRMRPFSMEAWKLLYCAIRGR